MEQLLAFTEPAEGVVMSCVILLAAGVVVGCVLGIATGVARLVRVRETTPPG